MTVDPVILDVSKWTRLAEVDGHARANSYSRERAIESLVNHGLSTSGRPPANLWMLSIRTPLGQGWGSLHLMEDAARWKLQEIIAEWGLQELYEADQLEYGISFLPVEY